MTARLLLARRQVRAGAVRDLGGHADRLAQRRVRMDRLADVHRVGAHLDGQRDLADHVAGVRADDAAAEDLAVAVRLGRVIEQQLGEALVAAVGDGAARGRPREQALLDLDALRLGLVFGQADPRHFWIGVGHRRDHASRNAKRYQNAGATGVPKCRHAIMSIAGNPTLPPMVFKHSLPCLDSTMTCI